MGKPNFRGVKWPAQAQERVTEPKSRLEALASVLISQSYGNGRRPGKHTSTSLAANHSILLPEQICPISLSINKGCMKKYFKRIGKVA